MIWAAWTGMGLFFLLIGRAWGLYPGGNRFDLQATHYSFLGNFLCDLFDKIAYNGVQNPGRPYAISGAYALALALLLYWWLVPTLFAGQAKQRLVVRIFGTIAMAFSFFIVIPEFHDRCILFAVPLGLVAFVASIHALMKNQEMRLAWAGIISVIVCVANYLSFAFQKFPTTLPGVQKAALISFLAWVIFGMLRLRALDKKSPIPGGIGL